MAKTIRWHSGVARIAPVKETKRAINHVYHDGNFLATKDNFILLAKRLEIQPSRSTPAWKTAVSRAFTNKPYAARRSAMRTLSNGEVVTLTPSDLRRIAAL